MISKKIIFFLLSISISGFAFCEDYQPKCAAKTLAFSCSAFFSSCAAKRLFDRSIDITDNNFVRNHKKMVSGSITIGIIGIASYFTYSAFEYISAFVKQQYSKHKEKNSNLDQKN